MNIPRLLTIAFYTPMTNSGWGIPLLATGKPGRAKTAFFAAFARKMRVPFLHLSPGQRGDGYFGVVPVPVVVNGETILTFPSNKDIKDMCDRGRGLILVDEVRTAPQIVRPALLGLLQERLFGDIRLPPGVRVMGASNSTKDATNGRPLSPPEANRVCHFDWHGFTAKEMRAYILASSDGDAFEDRKDPDYADWSEFDEVQNSILGLRKLLRATAGNQVFTFVDRRPTTTRDGKHVGEAIHMMPAPGTDACDGPWGSERSWSNVVETLWTYRAMKQLGIITDCPDAEKDDPELATLLRGFVGPVAGELLEWISEQDLPDYGEWLDGNTQVKFEKGRDDRAYLIFSGAGSHIVSLDRGPLRTKRAKSFFDLASKLVPKIGFECVMAGVKIVLDEARKTNNQSDVTHSEAHQFMLKYHNETKNIAAGKV